MNICSGNTREICKSDDIIKEKDDLIVKLPLIYKKKILIVIVINTFTLNSI